jgi:predicted NBD/HSP70 family sugar kinase
MAASQRSVLSWSAGGEATAGPALVGEIRNDVFATVLAEETLSRGEIANLLGVSPSTVTKAVTPLLANGYLEEVDAVRLGTLSVGRPSRRLRVNKARHAAIGVKVREDRLIGVLTNLRTEVLDYRTMSIADPSPEAVLDAVETVARGLITSAGGEDNHVLGLGVGISGHVDAAQRRSRHSALLGWHEVDVGEWLSSRTGLHTIVSNDVNALAVGLRWFGEGRNCESFVVVTLGTGVGCGLFLNGRLHVGVSGMAGEIGHIPIEPDGPLCGCGRHGCLEAVASYDAVLRGIVSRGGPRCRDIDEAIDLARSGSGRASAAAKEAFSTAGDALGRALAWLYNMLNPERLIIAGEGVKALALFRPSMTRALRAHTFSTAADDCDDVAILIDDTHWARGAACLTIDAAVSALDLGRR